MQVVKLHFRNKEYDKVIAKLSNINVYDLEFHEEAMYYFRLGYSYFSLNKYEEAKLAFKSDTSSKLNQYDLFLYLPKNMYKTNGMRAKCFYKEVPSNTVQRFIDRKVNDISDRIRVDVADFDWILLILKIKAIRIFNGKG